MTHSNGEKVATLQGVNQNLSWGKDVNSLYIVATNLNTEFQLEHYHVFQFGDEEDAYEIKVQRTDSIFASYALTVSFNDQLLYSQSLENTSIPVQKEHAIHIVLEVQDQEKAIRVAAFLSTDILDDMATYGKCFADDFHNNFRDTWATEICKDDENVERTFRETMRLRLDDLFLGSQQKDRSYTDGQGNQIEHLSLDKVQNFLNPGPQTGDGDAFQGELDFGSRVGTQEQMLSIFDRVLNHGRYQDTPEGGPVTNSRKLKLLSGDAFGFNIKLHEANNDNSISILLLCKQI